MSTSIPGGLSIRVCPYGTHPKINQWVSFSYDPGAFQAVAFVLGFEASFCVRPLREESLLPIAALPDVNSDSFQSRILPRLVSSSGEPDWDLDPFFLKGPPHLESSPKCESLLWRYWFWLYHISAPPPHPHVAFICILSCRKPVLLGFSLFSEIAVLYVLVLVFTVWGWAQSLPTLHGLIKDCSTTLKFLNSENFNFNNAKDWIIL